MWGLHGQGLHWVVLDGIAVLRIVCADLDVVVSAAGLVLAPGSVVPGL